MAPRIDPARLLGDLKALRRFGATGNGVVRTAFSDVDLESRQWLAGRMAEAGLAAEIDGVGNVFGRSANAGRALIIGSHSDTQPRGGWLDGALGVIYGLEVARALAADPESRHLPLDIASWMDEEGSYCGCLGSGAFTETMSDREIRAGANAAGETVAEALARAGLADRAPQRLDPARHAAYLEAHIEQGPVLEAEAKRIGVVTSIVGVRNFRIIAVGAQNHAGTTPMALRRDAGAALIDLAAELRRDLTGLLAERSVFTIGQIAFDPGAVSIIPGRAEMNLQIRDPEEAQLDRLSDAIVSRVRQADAALPVAVAAEPDPNDLVGARMNPGLQDHLAAAAEAEASGLWQRMPSGAAHDAQILSRRLPAGMLFIPSIGGVSHDFAEDSHEDDIVLGCQVLARAAASVLMELNGS